MDRLSALDASFLDQERGGAHMHIGAVMVCKGPAPTREEFAAHLESRLDRVPRYRQRLATPPLRLGKPFWIDAPDKRLAVAIVSYNGSVAVSVVADRDHVKDLDDLGEAIRASIREMVEAAEAAAVT